MARKKTAARVFGELVLDEEPAGGSTVTARLSAALETVTRPGDFAARGRVVSPLPSLVVDGIGRLSLPLPAAQAEALIASAERAPYGRGEATLVDTAVRRSWQVAPAQITIEDEAAKRAR
jgi:hypothetical protein